jgi:hypothetical protein
MRPRHWLLELAILVWAAPLGGCADTSASRSIPPCREQTGIIGLAYYTARDGQLIGRNLVIDGQTYCARRPLRSARPCDFTATGTVPPGLMDVIWSAADELVRHSPDVRKTSSRAEMGSANWIGIAVEPSPRTGEYVVSWPLGTEPADPKVRELLDLIHDADRGDSRSEFSPFRE